jgi:CMP-N-acetylneuraminic acid synthetase/2-polyprenyl-3-methyl-5-hydroxy-6-metoxy-1,4-benzoquinol methylase
MKNLAIIVARKGSKRIEGKNTRLFNGKPLFVWQIEFALSFKNIDQVVLSTNDEECIKIANSFNDLIIIKRPLELSLDNSIVEDALIFTINELEKKSLFYENIILLQPTNPCLNKDYLDKGLEMIESDKFSSIQTYYENRVFLLEDENIYDRPPTQKVEPKKIESGLFWIFKIQKFKKIKNRLIEPIGRIKIEEKDNVDIDHWHNFLDAENKLKLQMKDKQGLYYKKRSLPKSSFEGYHAENIDPDGKVRKIYEEKPHKVEFFKNEINFINNLNFQGLSRPKFLDLGCGTGFVSSELNDSYEKFGLEVANDTANFAKKYFSHMQVGYLDEHSYEDNFFDVIMCLHVVEHVENPVDLMKNIFRILKPNGYLILATPNFDGAMARRYKDNFRLLHDQTHISLFSDISLKDLTEDVGFFVDYIDYPYFETKYFNTEELEKIFNLDIISPPFYGNIFTIYARKK